MKEITLGTRYKPLRIPKAARIVNALANLLLLGTFLTPALAAGAACGTAGVHYDANGNPCTPIYGGQQIPVTQTVVPVPASTSTLLWTASLSARVLRIVPPVNNSTCLMQTDGNAATAQSTPIPSGYVFSLTEPPPSTNIYVWCPTAIVSPNGISVAQGN